jgi:L-fuconolactonase
MVRCGFGWSEQTTPPTSAELVEATAPYYLYCIEHFGPDRCMFESNFPVDKLSYGYTVVWNSFKRMTMDFSAAERSALFHDTATRVYRLES